MSIAVESLKASDVMVRGLSICKYSNENKRGPACIKRGKIDVWQSRDIFFPNSLKKILFELFFLFQQDAVQEKILKKIFFESFDGS